MCAHFTKEDLTQEEQDEVIRKTAQKILDYKMETIAILTLESIKPIVYIGGEMSRFIFAPLLPAMGHNFNEMGEKLITIFEDRDNIEKLIQLLEERVKEEKSVKKEKQKDKAENDKEEGQEKERKGGFRWWPFQF